MSLTSIYKIAEQAQRVIVGGDPTGDVQVAIQELILHGRQAFADIAKRTYFEGRNEGESLINGDFVYSFPNTPVLKDTSRDEYYSTLPATTITLPRDMGVYQISKMKHQNKAFIPVMNGFDALHAGLESELLEGNIGYYRENSRIYYTNFASSYADNITEVLMKLVAPLAGVDDEDQVNIPTDIQGEIVARTVTLYREEQAAPKDRANDDVK